MKSIPYVSGIVATDGNGSICNSDGRPIAHGTVYEKFDRVIFREYLDEMVDSRTLIVTGSNNYKQMKKLIPYTTSVCVSHANEESISLEFFVEKVTSGYREWRDYPQSMPRSDCPSVISDIYLHCMLNQLSKIVVLGGRSVYNMFSGHYSHFVHVRVPDNSRPANPNKRLSVFGKGDGFLIDPGDFVHVPFNDISLKVSIFDARGEIR